MTHLDLFSGIGGFAYAADQVWDDVEHTFVEFDPFCQQVLKKHWPESEIHGDIRQFTPNSHDWRQTEQEQQAAGDKQRSRGLDLLTGGFPCQPFSQAGVRRGTSDERYLWPEMLRVIRLSKPEWVIAENVNGLLTLQEGMVFEQVCLDLESAGYEVQPFIIPAVAVNAPHRRARVWFVGHAKHHGQYGAEDPQSDTAGNDRDAQRPDKLRQPKGTDSLRETVTYSRGEHGGSGRVKELETSEGIGRQGIQEAERFDLFDWGRDWLEVAAEFCSVDDGLPGIMGDTTITKSKHRAEQLKAYGNAIVPQVAIEIMKGMRI